MLRIEACRATVAGHRDPQRSDAKDLRRIPVPGNGFKSSTFSKGTSAKRPRAGRVSDARSRHRCPSCGNADQSTDAGGSWKDGAPLLERQVGRDDGGFSFMPAADDVVEQVGRSTVAGEVAKFVEYEQFGGPCSA